MKLNPLSLKSTALAALLAAGALANAGYYPTYSFNLPDQVSVTSIMMWEQYPGYDAATWAFNAGPGGSNTLVNPFVVNELPIRSLLIGIAQDLPGDPQGQKHIVLMMDNHAASLANHIAWGTLFRNTLEDQLIANLELATSGQDWDTVLPGVNAVGDFAFGDAKTGILDNLAQPNSAWFNFGGSFTVMTFSDGEIIGTGESYGTEAVPEPASMAAFGLGLAALARRRRKA
jgi:hypothetical protein